MDKPVWLKREAMARCARCSASQTVAVTAVGYKCQTCSTDWRWAVCGNCERVQIAREELPAVECARCHTVHVSWWKTADSESIAAMVAARRREVDTGRRRMRQAWAEVIGMLLGLALLALALWSRVVG